MCVFVCACVCVCTSVCMCISVWVCVRLSPHVHVSERKITHVCIQRQRDGTETCEVMCTVDLLVSNSHVNLFGQCSFLPILLVKLPADWVDA